MVNFPSQSLLVPRLLMFAGRRMRNLVPPTQFCQDRSPSPSSVNWARLLQHRWQQQRKIMIMTIIITHEKGPTIPSWFRWHFVGSMFWYRGHRSLQVSNNRRPDRLCDQISWIFFQVFLLKFSLLHYLSYLLNVFNNGIWKMYKKITNDLEPGLNLLEKGD